MPCPHPEPDPLHACGSIAVRGAAVFTMRHRRGLSPGRHPAVIGPRESHATLVPARGHRSTGWSWPLLARVSRTGLHRELCAEKSVDRARYVRGSASPPPRPDLPCAGSSLEPRFVLLHRLPVVSAQGSFRNTGPGESPCSGYRRGCLPGLVVCRAGDEREDFERPVGRPSDAVGNRRCKRHRSTVARRSDDDRARGGAEREVPAVRVRDAERSHLARAQLDRVRSQPQRMTGTDWQESAGCTL